MTTRPIIILLALFTPFFISAQSLSPAWARSAGGTGNDKGVSVAVNHHGGVYLGGTFSSASFIIGNTTLTNAGGSDIFLAKYDTAGNFLWAKQYGGTGNETLSKMFMEPNGTIYMTDNFQNIISIGGFSYTAPGIYLAKLDSNGNVQWVNKLPGTLTYPDLAADSRHNIYIAGLVDSSLSSFFVKKYNASGTLLNSISMVGSSSQRQRPLIAVDRADNLHAMYHSPSTNVTRNVYDSSGNFLSALPMQINQVNYYVNSYKAVYPNDYYYSATFQPLSSENTLYFGNASGSTSFFGCTKSIMNTDFDNMGNQFVAGNVVGSSIYGNCTGGFTLSGGSGMTIQGAVGQDIFFSSRTSSAGINSLSSTKLSGNTSEFSQRIAIDTTNHAMYVAGYWSKNIDSSKFYFGNSTLINAGNGSTSDMLLLKFGYQSNSLSINAGFDRVICLGGSVQLSGTASGGSGSYSYSWIPSTGLSNAFIANPIATVTSSTNYTLTVTDGAGTVARDTVNIIVNPALYKPTISVATGTNPFCEGQQINLIASAAVTYTWDKKTFSTTTIGNTAIISATDTITVTAVNSQGCIGTSDPFITVMKPRTPTPTILPLGNAAFCTGGSVTLTAQNIQSPVNYLWNTGATIAVITTQNPGTFSVTATGSNGCTSLAASKIVSVNSLPAGTIIASGSTDICDGDSLQLGIATAVSNTVLWNTGATTNSIWIKNSGTYSAQLTTLQGCTSTTSNTVTLQVRQRPNPSISQNGNELTVIPSAAAYQWHFNNSLITGANAQVLTITTGGNYKVTVTNANGCSASAGFGAILRIVNPSLTYQVFPNPAKDNLDISYSLKQTEKVTISIQNQQGQNIYTVVNNQQQQAGDYNYSISTNGLGKGLVYIEFIVGNKIVAHKQIIL